MCMCVGWCICVGVDVGMRRVTAQIARQIALADLCVHFSILLINKARDPHAEQTDPIGLKLRQI